MSANTPRILTKLDARIPPWNADDLFERACPFCDGRGEPRYVRPDSLQVRFCDACGTHFVSPAPTNQQLDRFYSTYYRQFSTEGSWIDGARAEDFARLDPMADFRIAELSSMMHLRGRHALDVGCGAGLVLTVLSRLGMKVSGIDLDPDAIAFLRDRLSIADARRCTIEELEPQVVYDVIIMHDLIEHPLRPFEMMRKAAGLLRPGGLISVWTPNGSFLAEEDEPLALRVDLEHMQYLSHRTCVWLAGRLGLEIAHLEMVGFPVMEGREGRPPAPIRWSGLRRALKRVPGLTRLIALRRRLQSAPPNLRLGRYSLFCIFRKG
jgi:2-polyprenyl-3-methyl-5-hydroxy-6-metoxy-1,4-benzoquinol methylase